MKAKMNNINASSLFHFTGRFDILQKIIRNGIRFSYAFEDLSYDVVNPVAPYLDGLGKSFERLGVAIPMISFCDIPIVRASNHIDRYGEYMIGLDKSMIIDMYNDIINPSVHDNFYKQQKKFKFGRIIWWKNLYNVLKISNFEEIFQDSLWLLTSRHHRAKIANYSTSCTPISEKQSICRASGSWQR